MAVELLDASPGRRAVLPALPVLEQQLVAAPVVPQQAVAVHPGRLDPGGVQDRRREVEQADEALVDDADIHAPRPVQEQRYMHRLQVRVGLREIAVLAPQVAVVGGEHHQRVPALVERSELLEDRLHEVVDRLQAPELGYPVLLDVAALPQRLCLDVGRFVGPVRLVHAWGALEGARSRVGVDRLGCRGRVGRHHRQMQEPRRRVVGFPLVEQGGCVVADQRRRVPVRDLHAPVDPPTSIRVERGLGSDRPTLEVRGVLGRRPPVEVLADDRRVVADLRQLSLDRPVVGERAVTERVVDPVVVGVLSGEDRGARGAAQGGGRERVREPPAPIAEPLRRRAHHVLPAVRTLIVGQDHQDVRRLARGRGCGVDLRPHDHAGDHDDRERRQEPPQGTDPFAHAQQW